MTKQPWLWVRAPSTKGRTKAKIGGFGDVALLKTPRSKGLHEPRWSRRSRFHNTKLNKSVDSRHGPDLTTSKAEKTTHNSVLKGNWCHLSLESIALPYARLRVVSNSRGLQNARAVTEFSIVDLKWIIWYFLKCWFTTENPPAWSFRQVFSLYEAFCFDVTDKHWVSIR